MTARTLGELLLAADGVTDSGLRLLDGRGRATRVSWAELVRSAGRTAGRLAAAGVEPGDRVALVYPTGRGFFDAFFGCVMAGAVPVPLYPPVRLGRLDEYHRRTAGMLDAVAVRMVLADRRIRRLLGETVAPAAPPLGCRQLAELPRAEPLAVASEPEALALVQFSSGTTLAPKPVMLSHRALLAQTRLLNGFWPDQGELRHSGVSWLPLYHDMGLIGCVLPALERRTDLTLIGPERFVAEPAVWLRAISRYRATVSPAPNFAYGLCVEKIRDEQLAGVDLSSWRVALNGAEAVSPEVLRQFAERFAPWGFRRQALTPVYGLSEAALAVTFSALDGPFVGRRFDRQALYGRGEAVARDDGVELVSVGRPLPGFELSLRAPDGQPVADGRTGRLWVRGPSLMAGYFGRPDDTAEVLVDGWLDTGDQGFVDGGELFLTGRVKDLIIVRGRNHAPEEIEYAVYGLPGVRTGCTAAVAYLPEGGEREELLLLVELRPAADGDLRRELPELCRQRVLAAAGLALDRVVLLEPGTLPRTSSGKIRRQDALRRYRDGRLAPPAAVNVVTLARAMVRSRRAFGRTRSND